MTKEITKAKILQEIQDKFRLREFLPEKFLFAETVIPVYNIEKHTQTWVITRKSVTATGTGGILLRTVPENEQWALRAYDVVFVSGVFTATGLYITRVQEDPTYFIYLDLTAGQSTSYHITLPSPVVLQPGDEIQINIDGYTSSGVLYIYLDVMKEEIR